jgi:Mn-dependent DtxR family transcriptional regulator
MEKMIFKRTLDELSDADRTFLYAMSVDDGESRLSDVKDRMGVSTNYANQYRIRLIEQGVIGSRGRGKLGFEIPMLRDYLREQVR